MDCPDMSRQPPCSLHTTKGNFGKPWSRDILTLKALMWRRRTVPRIHIQHLLDQPQLDLPELIPPPFSLVRSEGYVLETPLAVVPYPIDLRVDLQVGSGEA